MQQPSSEHSVPPALDNTISQANQAASTASAVTEAMKSPVMRRLLHTIRMEGHKKRKFYIARKKKAQKSRAVRARQIMARRGKRKGQRIDY